MTGTHATLTRFTAARALIASLDEAGRPLVVGQQLRPVLAVATILDAEATGHLTLALDGRRTVLRATGLTPTDELMATVVAGCDDRTVRSAVNRIALFTWSGNTVELRAPLLERLAAEGVVERTGTRRGGRATWLVDPQARSAVVDPLVAVLTDESGAPVTDPALQRLTASVTVSSVLAHRIVRSAHGRAASPRLVHRRTAEVRAAEPVAAIGHRALSGLMGAAAA
ncbi:GPP34 family phosphoprotein [Salana multivorans]